MEDDAGSIVFYSKSTDALPTFGAKESRHGQRGNKAVLVAGHRKLAAEFPAFRKMLSNFYVIPGGLRVPMSGLCKALHMGADALHGAQAAYHFHTAEHAFHFAKLWKTGHKPEALKFTIDLGDPLGASVDGGVIKKAGGKNGVKKLTPAEIGAWAKVTTAALGYLMKCKFSAKSSPSLVRMLLLTTPLQLWHLRNPRAGSDALALERWHFLEEQRDKLATGRRK